MHASLAEKVSTDLKIINSSFYQLIDQNSFNSKFKLNLKYMNRALNISQSNVSDFQSKAKLYYLSFINNFLNGNLQIALEHGFIAKNLLYHIHDNNTLLKLLPELILCSLYFHRQLQPIKKLLTEFESITFETPHLISSIWYDCLCLNINLTFNIENELQIDHFIQKVNNPTVKNEFLINFYFNSTLMLYYCRKNDIIKAEKYFRQANKSKNNIKFNSFLYALGLLKLVEYQLRIFARFITEHSLEIVIKYKLHSFLVSLNVYCDLF